MSLVRLDRIDSIARTNELENGVAEPKTWMCLICGWIYDEAVGDPEHGIPAGTRREDVPDDWKCPECDGGKADFQMAVF